MNLFQIIKMSINEMKSNKLRSFLTILGTAIGTASVILFVTISIGSRQSMYKEMESIPPDILTVELFGTDESNTLNYEDLEGLSKYSSIKDISPVIKASAQIRSGKVDKDTELLGIDENYKSLNNIKIKSGRFINSIDIDSYNKVVVIGSSVAKELFQLKSPVGKYIEINSTPYKIVGVLKQAYDDFESRVDQQVYIPLSNAKSISDKSGVSNIYIKAENTENVYPTIDDVKSYLISKLGNDNDFYIDNNQEMKKMMESMDSIMDIMIGAISGISLFVAGIGIMNMMLVSVTERTKEIGIRKALGAKRKSILSQFLIESLIISLVGGLIGAIVGILGSNAVLSMMKADPFISWNVVVISIMFAVSMGVIFGIVPANKASKLQPITALKSE